MKQQKRIFNFDNIDNYNRMFGFETLHPLVTVLDFSKAVYPENYNNEIVWQYGVYALYLKETQCGNIEYGHKPYDYAEGTVMSFAPGQVAVTNLVQANAPTVAYALLFHPDFIRGTSLGQNIDSYSFFHYTSHEALHLSERERQIFIETLEKIRKELEYPIDRYTRKLVCNEIETLLQYCLRFYDRQFVTRQDDNLAVVTRFEKALLEHFSQETLYFSGIPSVKYFAEKCFYSPNYFGDLIKKETGRTAQDMIQQKVIDKAKEMLRSSNLSVGKIAERLGFEYSQHFNRYFKRIVMMTPTEYRNSKIA